MARHDRIEGAGGEALWDWMAAHAREEALKQLRREGWRPPPSAQDAGRRVSIVVVGVLSVAMLAGLWWGFAGGRHDGPTRLAEWHELRETRR